MTMNASLHRELLELGVDGQAEWWVDAYAQLTGGQPVPDVWWRERQRLTDVCEQMRVGPAVREVFLAAAERIDAEAPSWWTLLAMADRLYRCDDDDLREAAVRRPAPSRSRWGELADLFPALVHLTGLNHLIQLHRAHGFSPQLTRAAADDLVVRMEKFHARHGRWGTTDVRNWFGRHLRLKLFTLGRLQFEYSSFQLPYMAITNGGGAVVVLLEAGNRMRADGQFACADGGIAVDDGDNWSSTLCETEDAWIGHRIHHDGWADRQVQRYRKSEWRVFLRRGDGVLTVHIPERGRLEPSACVESFELAQRFFPRHYPDLSPQAFVCISWLMDPQLARVLNDRSNLCQFLSLFHCVPRPRADDQQLFERVFDGKRTLADMPRDTTLRRRICAEIEAGRRWRTAGGIRPFGQSECGDRSSANAPHGVNRRCIAPSSPSKQIFKRKVRS